MYVPKRRLVRCERNSHTNWPGDPTGMLANLSNRSANERCIMGGSAVETEWRGGVSPYARGFAAREFQPRVVTPSTRLVLINDRQHDVSGVLCIMKHLLDCDLELVINAKVMPGVWVTIELREVR